MRALTQPAIIKSAAIAAAFTTLVCFPRLVSWGDRPTPLWYLGLSLALAAFVLWSFVFAWHGKYTGRQPFALCRQPLVWVTATFCGATGALFSHYFTDPILRAQTPEDFPHDIATWLTMALFTLSFNQLFLILAPLDFFIRLAHRRRLAVALVILFNVFVVYLKLSWP